MDMLTEIIGLVASFASLLISLILLIRQSKLKKEIDELKGPVRQISRQAQSSSGGGRGRRRRRSSGE